MRRILISTAFQPDRPNSDVYGLPAEPPSAKAALSRPQLATIYSRWLQKSSVYFAARLWLKFSFISPFGEENLIRQYPFARALWSREQALPAGRLMPLIEYLSVFAASG